MVAILAQGWVGGTVLPHARWFDAMPPRQRSAGQRGHVAVRQHILLGVKPHTSHLFWCCITVLPAFFTGVFATFVWLLWSA